MKSILTINAVILVLSFIYIRSALAFEQSYETCSLTVWDLLQIADYYEAKVPIDAVIAQSKKLEDPAHNIELMYSLAEEEGLGVARLNALHHYMICVKDAKSHTDQSVFSNKKSPYYTCADAAAMNFVVLFNLQEGETADTIKAKYPSEFDKKIDLFANLSKNYSMDYAISSATKTTSECIEDARKLEKK